MADEPIRGALRDPSTGGRVAGLSVEAWDSAHALKQPLGQATSDAGGEFQILLSPGMQEQLIARKENVYFRVLRNGTVAVDTAGTIQWQPAAPGPVVIDVPAGPIVVPVPYDVHGRVVTDRGTAAAGLQVQVWDHQLTGADLIAAGTTSGDGTYEVPYDPGRLSGKQLGDLDVRVLQGDLPGPDLTGCRPRRELRRRRPARRARPHGRRDAAAARRYGRRRRHR